MNGKLTNKFVVVIPSWNVESLIGECLESIFSQTYGDIGIIIRDDMSTDGTVEMVKSIINGRDNVLLVENTTKFNAVGNIYDSVINYIDENSVVGIVDGDDKLMNVDAVKIIMDKYEDPNIWMVWSQHMVASDGSIGQSCPLPPDSHIPTRGFWSTSHFRTHRAKLFHHLNIEDLKDPDNRESWCIFAGDAIYLYPLCEMCMNEHSMFIPDVLYYYRDNLPTNDDKKEVGRSFHTAALIRGSGRRYNKLEQL